jgi:hypothetical protein
MFLEHDGERVSILVEGRAHTQSVLAVVRMEPSGRTLTALGRTFPSATVRALWRLSEAFLDQGRSPLSDEEEERVLSEVRARLPSSGPSAISSADEESTSSQWCSRPTSVPRTGHAPARARAFSEAVRVRTASVATRVLAIRESGSGSAVDGAAALVMEIEFGGVQLRVPDGVNPHHVAALVAALASRY